MASPAESFKTLPKWGKAAVAIGGAGVVYVMYKRRASGTSGSSSSTSPASGTDPVTGLPYSMDTQVDPQTGQTYLAEAQQYGSVSAAEAAVSGGAAYGYGSGYSGGYPVSAGTTYTGTGTTLGTTSGYGSNAQWSQAAQQGLADIGYDPTSVADALGAYLAGQPLTSAQVAIVQAAIAEYGAPPSGSFQIVQQPTKQPVSSGTIPGGIGDGTVPLATVPDVIGQPQEAAYAILSEAGLHASGSKVVHGKVIYVVSQSPKAGAKVKKGTTVRLTSKLR